MPAFSLVGFKQETTSKTFEYFKKMRVLAGRAGYPKDKSKHPKDKSKHPEDKSRHPKDKSKHPIWAKRQIQAPSWQIQAPDPKKIQIID